jgi:hypothetical protein
MSGTSVSFAADILGQLYKYQGQMMWRLDLANYDDVKANASIIMSMITSADGPPAMPPPPFPPFPQGFIDTFAAWVKQGCPP